MLNPNFMNAAIGRLFTKIHHDKKKGAEKRRGVFVKLDIAFCLEWTLNTVEGKLMWDRCYNSFCVKSDQCTSHGKTKYKDGPEKIFRFLLWGEKVTWGMLKNYNVEEKDRPLTEADYLKLLEELFTTKIEQAVADDLPAEGLVVEHKGYRAKLSARMACEKHQERQDLVAGVESQFGNYAKAPDFITKTLHNKRAGLTLKTLLDAPETDDPVPKTNQLTLNGGPVRPTQREAHAPAVMGARRRYGKNGGSGIPELHVKTNKQPKGRGKTNNADGFKKRGLQALADSNEKGHKTGHSKATEDLL